MARNIFGNCSRDGYYWGYVDKYKRLMEFEDRDAYLEYISELDDVMEPYWKQRGSSYFHNNYTSYNEEVKSNETQRT